MAYKVGFRGQSYDDKYPLYAEATPELVVNTKSLQTLTKASVQAAMTLEGYSMPAAEMGPSAQFEADYRGWWNNDAVTTGTGTGTGTPAQAPTIAPVTGLPITGDAGGTLTVDLDFDFHGAVKAGTVTVTYAIAGGADQTATATLLGTETPTQAAGKIKDAIHAVAELTASKSGSTITVTPTDTTVLTKLEASFA